MSQSLILGGTKGLGFALAHESAARGIEPIVTGRSADDPAVAAALPPTAARVVMDLASAGSIERAFPQLPQDTIDYFFWNAGIWPGRVPFRELAPGVIDAIIATNLAGPLKLLQKFHAARVALQRSYHLIAISSVSAWRIRSQETVYCASKDAQAVFVLNFADELARELPGARAMVVYPGGMKTDIFKGRQEDTTGYMDPRAVAKAIWDEIQKQTETCREMHLVRDKKKNDGSFFLEYGPKPRGVR